MHGLVATDISVKVIPSISNTGQNIQHVDSCIRRATTGMKSWLSVVPR